MQWWELLFYNTKIRPQVECIKWINSKYHIFGVHIDFAGSLIGECSSKVFKNIANGMMWKERNVLLWKIGLIKQYKIFSRIQVTW